MTASRNLPIILGLGVALLMFGAAHGRPNDAQQPDTHKPAPCSAKPNACKDAKPSKDNSYLSAHPAGATPAERVPVGSEQAAKSGALEMQAAKPAARDDDPRGVEERKDEPDALDR